MIYGYCRVSTKGQAAHGNSLEEQEQRLRHEGAQNIVQEQFTGSRMSRPKLDVLIAKLQTGDTLMVTKLDRLARNVEDGIKVINILLQSGVKVHVLNVGILDNSPMGKFFITTLLAVAELERSMIIERMQEGKEIARTKDGFREGRPPISADIKAHAVHLVLDEHKTYREVAKITGMSTTTLTKAVRAAREEYYAKEAFDLLK